VACDVRRTDHDAAVPRHAAHEYILALCKPAGVLVHPSRGHHNGTLYNGLLYYFRERRAADPSCHIGTVHRLDEETSGIMIYALCKKAHKDLTNQFEKRTVKKTYVCLVHGAAQFETTVIEEPIGTDPENRLRCAIMGLDARTAKTTFVRLGVSPCGQFSLLRAHPHTGRTHQIRIHAKALGHSLVGDLLYDGLKEHVAYGELNPRCCLHAESLALNHPVSQRPIILRADIPDDMKAMAAQLGLDVNLS
jgi:23S rRNA pseudouridine1911/1915/1917 synthase